MNSYFATVEQQANPLLRGRPIVVGGSPSTRTVVAAASIEAKRFGVKSGMSLPEALSLCPSLVLVEGDQEKYMFVTMKFINIFKDYTPIIEIFSIDEAFLDVTETAKRFNGAVSIAEEIKKRLRNEVGEWMKCSVGIGPSKLIAKLASDMKKPDGLVLVKREEIPALLNRMKLSDLCGIGKRMEKRLINAGIDNMEKLRAAPERFLLDKFGIIGKVLHRMSLGEDSSPVLPYYESPDYKSMGHHYTFPSDIYEMPRVKKTLLRLSEQVGRRLRSGGYAGKTVTFTMRARDFTSLRKQSTLAEFINDGYSIYREASRIMDSFGFSGAVRMIGVSVSNLIKDYCQIPILAEDRKNVYLIEAIDRINNKYGEFTIERASLMETKLRKRVGGFMEMKKLG